MCVIEQQSEYYCRAISAFSDMNLLHEGTF